MIWLDLSEVILMGFVCFIAINTFVNDEASKNQSTLKNSFMSNSIFESRMTT
jgi:hypothetical protein